MSNDMVALSRPRTPSEAVVAARLRGPDQRLVYRRLVDAVARPGRMVWMPAALVARVPTELLPALVLADRSTPLCVVEPDPPLPDGISWSAAVAAATRSPLVDLAGADLAVARRPLGPADVAAWRAGDREGVRHLIVGCAALRPGGFGGWTSVEAHARGVLLEIRGPGVEDRRTLSVAGLDADDVRAVVDRQAPAGCVVHCWLVADTGAAVGLPMSSRVAVLDEWRLAG
jgi:alpha-D-ribose 1-methylphosphonate 5-triphosphate synthase subunit PhnH